MNTEEKYKRVRELVLKYSYLGTKVDPVNGALLIGKAPHIAPYAWLNKLYPPLDSVEFKELRENLEPCIPSAFEYFLKDFSNGLNIICGTLCLYGKRKNYIRDLANAWQPFSIIEPNTYEYPDNATDEMLFIGSYGYDGSNLYITPDDEVHFCTRWDAKSLMTWRSLPDMLIEEIERIYTLFDEKGQQLVEDYPTTPIILE